MTHACRSISPISFRIWDAKYRLKASDGKQEASIEETWRRVARSLAGVERSEKKQWENRFYDILDDFRFLPGGRILTGAASGRAVTLFNCFAMGTIEDSLDSIFDALKEGAVTMQQGGGIGCDFSTLRPAGTPARRVGGVASGPVSFMAIWDRMCATLLSTGARRGAMMGTLRCDHPGIESFIDAKREGTELRNFNLSVLVTDAFMQAVKQDEPWPLLFPITPSEETADVRNRRILMRAWPPDGSPVPCRVFRVMPARALWRRIMQATYDYAEPGVLFIDRMNRMNNLWYREQICTTNPCGEIPLPPYGACDLGSINLTRFVSRPFRSNARFDTEALEATTKTAVRLLDNVIDASRFPLEKQQAQALATRRIGLGIAGLGDALIMLGLRYGSDDSLRTAADVMKLVCHTAYRSSVELAREKGAFPCFEADQYLKSPFIRSLPRSIQQAIAADGIRNSHLLAIAPTGSISLLANNVSNGLEPVFAFHCRRRVLSADDSYQQFELTDYALRLWHEQFQDRVPSPAFVAAREIAPTDHLKMQAAIQRFVDQSIAKTINVPEDYDFSEFRSLYEEAYDMGLKGCTTFRPNPVTGAVLIPDNEAQNGPHCCDVEREGD
jgi:ribonucleoside-diphosphate reductase alpha chain